MLVSPPFEAKPLELERQDFGFPQTSQGNSLQKAQKAQKAQKVSPVFGGDMGLSWRFCQGKQKKLPILDKLLCVDRRGPENMVCVLLGFSQKGFGVLMASLRRF